jgi:ketosteroid isomerase-like protein
MKKIIFPIALLFIVVLISCEEKVDIEKEKAAVKAVIYGETDAYVKQDTAKMFSFYMKDVYQTRIQASRDTFYIYRGWNDISSRFKKMSWAGVTNFKYVKDFVEIKIIEETAWAIYKETQTYELNGVPKKYELLLTMVLEKEEEQWKISCFTVINVTPPPPALTTVEEKKK